MQYGVLLKKTREQRRLTQEGMGEKLYLDTSVISKLENDFIQLKFSRMIEWLVVVNRIDILILLINGMDIDTIMKTAFTDQYLNEVSKTNLSQITVEEIKENLEKPFQKNTYRPLD